MKTIIVLLFTISYSLCFGQIPNDLTNEEKVYGLSKFWQEVNYSFIYYNDIDQAEWDDLYKKYVTEVQKTKNDYEYYRLLQKFCAYLKDGHTNVWFPKEIQENVFNTNFGEYRILLNSVEGKAIITRVNKSKKNEIPLGTEVLSVNGIVTESYLSKYVIPYISSSTDYMRQVLAVQYMLQGYKGTEFHLKLKFPDGTIKNMTFVHSKTEEKELYPPLESSELLTIKWYDDIAYVGLNSFSNWEISSEFVEKIPELKQAKALVLDLRKNGGGTSNIGKVILHHLTKDTIFYGPKSQSRQYIPTLKAWNKAQYYYDFPYKPDSLGSGDKKILETTRIVVPTAILIGHGTASAAEDFLIYTDNQEHMIKIGEPTFGSTGQPLMFSLPNGGLARVCTKKDTYPDGRVFVGVGIQPDIEVSKKLVDYIENKDPVLDRAIEYLNKNK